MCEWTSSGVLWPPVSPVRICIDIPWCMLAVPRGRRTPPMGRSCMRSCMDETRAESRLECSPYPHHLPPPLSASSLGPWYVEVEARRRRICAWMSDTLGRGQVDEAGQNLFRHEAPNMASASVPPSPGNGRTGKSDMRRRRNVSQALVGHMVFSVFDFA